MVKGIIFDLDGTLLNSMFMWDSVCEDYLISLGIQPRENLRETFKSFSLRESALYYQKEYGVNLSIEEIMDGINKMIEKFYFEEALLKDGVKNFIKLLDATGIKMCIATATDKYLVKAVLKRHRISRYFSKIFTCGEVGESKRSPLIYRKAMEHLKCDRSNCMIFEDSLFALKTAHGDGFYTAAVKDPHEIHQDEMIKLSNLYITDFNKLDDFWQFAIKI